MNEYANILSEGKLLPIDEREAVHLYKQSADKGCLLGIINYINILEEKDENKEEGLAHY